MNENSADLATVKMTIDQNTAAIDVNTGNISAADGIINTGENDVDQIE